MKKILFAVLILAVTLFVGCTPTKTGGNSKVLDLTLNLEKGNSFIYRHSNSTEIDMEVMGMKQKSLQNQVTDYLYEVKDVAADGKTSIDLMIKDMSVSQESPQGNLEYDSRSKGDVDLEANPALKVYQASLGNKMNMVLSSDGDLVDFSGADAMYEKIFSDESFKEIAGTMKDLMIAQFGDEAMKESMKGITDFLPPTPVKTGKSWKTNQIGQANLGLISDNVYTLTKRDKGIAYINIVSVITSNPEAKGLDMGMMQVKYNLTGTQTGTIEVDEKTGWANKLNLKQDMKGEMLLIGAAVGGEMTADVVIKGVQSYNTLEK